MADEYATSGNPSGPAESDAAVAGFEAGGAARRSAVASDDAAVPRAAAPSCFADACVVLRTDRLQVDFADGHSGPALRRILAQREVATSYFVETPAAAALSAERWDWRAPPGSLTLAARWRTTGKVVACVRVIDGQLSYFVDAASWCHGIGRELLDAVVSRYAGQPDALQLRAVVDRANEASRRLLERIGFEPCGVETDDICRRCGHTMLRYRLSRRDGHVFDSA